jgi:hypothetical protein
LRNWELVSLELRPEKNNLEKERYFSGIGKLFPWTGIGFL